MSDFSEGRNETDAAQTVTQRASAHLPGLDIEVTHRRAVGDDAEQISINLRAAPSFAAFGRALEANPLVFWAQSAGWFPWFETARMMRFWSLPWTLAPTALPWRSGDSPPRSEAGPEG